MRLLVQPFAPVGLEGVTVESLEGLEVGRRVEEALGPEEKVGARRESAAAPPKLRVRVSRRVGKVPGSALRVEPAATANASISVDFPLPFSPTK